MRIQACVTSRKHPSSFQIKSPPAQPHNLAGRLIVPSANKSKAELDEVRTEIHCPQSPRDGDWTPKRVQVYIDGHIVDAVILVRPKTAANGRWALSSLGNGETYEEQARDRQFKGFLTDLNSNAIIFNYPGVGAPLTLEDIAHDGIISPEGSLAAKLLSRGTYTNKQFIATRAGHNDGIPDTLRNSLVPKILAHLPKLKS